MDSPSEKPHEEVEIPAWVGFAKFLMLMGMVAMFFWLSHAMVQHHFFTGGELNNPQAAVGP
jgi:hypothetical protein